ncbi:MAG: hypothetical protein P4L50_00100 [Anaerolineaceae bacterium]|nr:hypothetical protein [Anaerolineaceae bacterium]
MNIKINAFRGIYNGYQNGNFNVNEAIIRLASWLEVNYEHKDEPKSFEYFLAISMLKELVSRI